VEAQRTRRSNSDEDTATKQLIQTTSSSPHHSGSAAVCRVTLLDGNQLDVPLQVTAPVFILEDQSPLTNS